MVGPLIKLDGDLSNNLLLNLLGDLSNPLTLFEGGEIVSIPFNPFAVVLVGLI